MLRQLMHWERTITAVLWFSVPVMEILLLLQARRRRLWHACPAFFVYIAFHVARFLLLFSMRSYLRAYFVAYWITELMDIALVVFVLYELYSYLFKAYEGLRALQDALFRWSVAVCILVAVVIAASLPGSEPDRIVAGLLAFDLGVAVLKAGLIVFAMAMSSALALRWSHYAFAILVGMALCSSVELATVAVRLQIGPAASMTYRLLKAAAYDCGVLVWVAYFVSKERDPATLRSIPQNDLASWNQALLELLTK